MKGYIFDFNGTLFWDSAYHEQAWQNLAMKIRSSPLSSEEIRTHLHGRPNSDVFEYLHKRKLSAVELTSNSEEKEIIYRSICQSLNGGFRFADGVQELLNLLREKRIPMTIATSSEYENLQLFIRQFGLSRWFNLEKIVYDDGTFKGKPAPDIFLLAAEKLNLFPSECTVFEDSFSGIRAAIAAGIGRIVYVNSCNIELDPELVDKVYLVIRNFAEFSPF